MAKREGQREGEREGERERKKVVSSTDVSLAIRVARFGLFKAKNNKLSLFSNWLGSKFFRIYKVIGLIKSLEVYILKSNIFPFLKQSLATFQLQAPGNPVVYISGAVHNDTTLPAGARLGACCVSFVFFRSCP